MTGIDINNTDTLSVQRAIKGICGDTKLFGNLKSFSTDVRKHVHTLTHSHTASRPHIDTHTHTREILYRKVLSHNRGFITRMGRISYIDQ